MKLIRLFHRDRCFTFELCYPDRPTCTVLHKESYRELDPSCATSLATHVFQGTLTPDEVKSLFGEFHIPEGWKACSVYSDGGLSPTGPLTKKAVIHMTACVRRWWVSGIEKCWAIIREQKLDGWLEGKHVVWEGGQDA